MSEYRALTNGGCIAGSQTFTENGTFTAPSGVTKVKIVIGSHTYYFSVSSGSNYSVTPDFMDNEGSNIWIFNGNWLWYATTSLIIYWSNAINNS